MNKEIEKLQEIIDDSENIVFFGGAGYLQRAIFRIFEVRTACISRNTSIHRNRSSVIPSLSAIQKDFMNFTKKR